MLVSNLDRFSFGVIKPDFTSNASKQYRFCLLSIALTYEPNILICTGKPSNSTCFSDIGGGMSYLPKGVKFSILPSIADV